MSKAYTTRFGSGADVLYPGEEVIIEGYKDDEGELRYTVLIRPTPGLHAKLLRCYFRTLVFLRLRDDS